MSVEHSRTCGIRLKGPNIPSILPSVKQSESLFLWNPRGEVT